MISVLKSYNCFLKEDDPMDIACNNKLVKVPEGFEYSTNYTMNWLAWYVPKTYCWAVFLYIYDVPTQVQSITTCHSADLYLASPSPQHQSTLCTYTGTGKQRGKGANQVKINNIGRNIWVQNTE